MTGPQRVLILCTGNSCRSQMAEGLWRHLGGISWEVHSAGSHPAGYVHPGATAAMAEIGIDIRPPVSKPLTDFVDEPFDLMITVCDHAAEQCPVFPGNGRRLHWPFNDPAREDDPAQQSASFRRVRDEIRSTIAAYLRGEPVPKTARPSHV